MCECKKSLRAVQRSSSSCSRYLAVARRTKQHFCTRGQNNFCARRRRVCKIRGFHLMHTRRCRLQRRSPTERRFTRQEPVLLLISRVQAKSSQLNFFCKRVTSIYIRTSKKWGHLFIIVNRQLFFALEEWRTTTKPFFLFDRSRA